MKSDGLQNHTKMHRHAVVSEWEDNIMFDADDPDFRSSSTSLAAAAGHHPTASAVLNALLIKGEYILLRLLLYIYVIFNKYCAKSCNNFHDLHTAHLLLIASSRAHVHILREKILCTTFKQTTFNKVWTNEQYMTKWKPCHRFTAPSSDWEARPRFIWLAALLLYTSSGGGSDWNLQNIYFSRGPRIIKGISCFDSIKQQQLAHPGLLVARFFFFVHWKETIFYLFVYVRVYICFWLEDKRHRYKWVCEKVYAV